MGHRGDARSTSRGYEGRHAKGYVPPEESMLLEEKADACECCQEHYWTSPDDDGLCISCTHPKQQHQKEYDGPPGSEFEWTS